ncbi:MAG: hypothetical protein ACXAC7_07370 [Candidatus Hodarchaeales archaeon]
MSQVFLDQVSGVFNKQGVVFKENYLQSLLLLLLNSFYPEHLPSLYPFTYKTGLKSKFLGKVIDKLIQHDLIHIDNCKVQVKPTSTSERKMFPRICNMEPKIFFDFLMGFSQRNHSDLQTFLGQNDQNDPMNILILLYSIIAIAYAQILHKKGIKSPALLLNSARFEVMENIMESWAIMVPELREILDVFIEPLFRSYFACYGFLIDSYFPQTTFDIK